MRYVAVLDACVLYPALVRNILLSLAAADLYRAKWTDDIQREWVDSLLANRPDVQRSQIDKTCAEMSRSIPNCLVKNYQPLIGMCELPDENDRHVLAAAIRCNAHAIVTANLADFPKHALIPYDIEVQHPDDFIVNQIDLSTAYAVTAIKAMRARMRNPAYTPSELLAAIERHQLPQTATYLRDWQALI